MLLSILLSTGCTPRWVVDNVCPDCSPDEARVLAYGFTAYWQEVKRQHNHDDLVWHWQLVADCESGDDPHIATGNGYYGWLQFLPSTWASVGGAGLPSDHDRGEQAYRAEILKDRSGLGQWPVCGRDYR